MVHIAITVLMEIQMVEATQSQHLLYAELKIKLADTANVLFQEVVVAGSINKYYKQPVVHFK